MENCIKSFIKLFINKYLKGIYSSTNTSSLSLLRIANRNRHLFCPRHHFAISTISTSSSSTSRAVHGLGQVGFGPDPDSTRLNRVTKIATCNRPDIWGRPSGSGHQLIGSDWSVWRVWAWEIGRAHV